MQVHFGAESLNKAAMDIQAKGAALGSLMASELAALAPAIEAMAVDEMRSVTPVRTGRLRDSTRADSVMKDLTLETTITQPAETLPDQAGRWGGEHYVRWVVGGRGPVVPIFAKALAGPNFGPVAYAGPAAANPYPDEAAPFISTALTGIAKEYTVAVNAWVKK